MGATALLAEHGRRGRGGRSGWGFRTVRLNAAGTAAVLAPGALAGAGLGLLTSPTTPSTGSPTRNLTRVLILGVGGALTGLILARVADERRWRGMMTTWQLDEPDEVLDLMQAIRAAGVEAEMIRADEHAHPDLGAYALRYRARDEPRVRALMSARRR
jgi:hypothetical protein